MICKHCGKEIPDESLFCGYCGNRVEEEPDANEEIIAPVNLEEETVPETPAAEEAEIIAEEAEEETAAPEEAVEEIQEEIAEVVPEETIEEILPPEEIISPEPVNEEEPEPVIEIQPEPVIVEEPEPVIETKPVPVTETEQEAVREVQPEPAVIAEPVPAKERNLPKVNIKASDFTPLLGVLKDPFNEHELGYPAAAAVLILGLIANWMSFGFGYGLLVLLVIWAGTACVLYIAKRKEFDLQKLVSTCAQLLVMPTAIMLLCGLVSLLGYSSLFVLVRLFLVFLAMMIYISALGRYTASMNKYALALVLAVLFAVAAACMISAFADMYISLNI